MASLFTLVKGQQRLARQALGEYSLEVDAILRDRSQDSRRIEQLLDGILDFCFQNDMIGLYKKLCRYYFQIDSRATAFYVHAYQEMWDGERVERLTGPSFQGVH